MEVWVRTDPKRNSEPAARRFLVARAEAVRLTAGGYKETERDAFLRHHGADLMEEIRNNRRYPDIEQPFGTFTHYLFRLSPTIREEIKERGLFWLDGSLGYCGLEDPVFYVMRPTHALIGSVISHERMISLYVTEEELDVLRGEPGFAAYP